MEQSIKLKTDELNPTLIEGLKKYFKAIKTKEVTISFSAPAKKFLRPENQSKTNARIDKIINDAEHKKAKWVSFTGEEFEELSKALSKINE